MDFINYLFNCLFDALGAAVGLNCEMSFIDDLVGLAVLAVLIGVFLLSGLLLKKIHAFKQWQLVSLAVVMVVVFILMFTIGSVVIEEVVKK